VEGPYGWAEQHRVGRARIGQQEGKEGGGLNADDGEWLRRGGERGKRGGDSEWMDQDEARG
jgi:hypothetical protein